MTNLKYGNGYVWLWSVPLMICVLFGCSDPLDRQMAISDLDSPTPTVRVMAIKWAGDNKVTAAVPQLVDYLQNEDKSVRFYAIQALKRITGKDLGYDYKAPAHFRSAAVKRWQGLLDTNEF